MLQELIALTVEVTGCDACLGHPPDHDTGDIVLRASQLPHDAEIGSVRLNAGEGIAGWVAQHKSAVALTNHAFADPRFKHFTTLIEDTFEALISVPLVRGGEVIGVLNVHHREPHEHTPEEISVLCFLGDKWAVPSPTPNSPTTMSSSARRQFSSASNWRNAKWSSAPRESCSSASASAKKRPTSACATRAAASAAASAMSPKPCCSSKAVRPRTPASQGSRRRSVCSPHLGPPGFATRLCP